jgi:hypothetical protein
VPLDFYIWVFQSHINHIMLTTADFFNYGRIVGWITIGTGALAVLAFLLKWGFRFRLVGATGFFGVLTSGLFALSFVPIIHAQIPGAARYSLVYDNGGTTTVITVASDITPTQLEATLQQAASDLFSPGRLGQSAAGNTDLTIRARTVLHPQDKVSTLLTLGEVHRSLTQRADTDLEIKVFTENFKQLPTPVG